MYGLCEIRGQKRYNKKALFSMILLRRAHIGDSTRDLVRISSCHCFWPQHLWWSSSSVNLLTFLMCVSARIQIQCKKSVKDNTLISEWLIKFIVNFHEFWRICVRKFYVCPQFILSFCIILHIVYNFANAVKLSDDIKQHRQNQWWGHVFESLEHLC